MRIIAGWDIGGTKCAVVLARLDGDRPVFLGRKAFATPPNWQNTLERCRDLTLALLEEQHLRLRELFGVGVSCGGPLDSKSGIVLSPPNLPGWDKVPVTQWIERCLQVPAKLRNDADACAAAEWQFGAGRGCRNMIFLTFGTGLGAGLILDGKLFTGASDSAGELGHWRMEDEGPVGYGKAGSLEGFCSGSGLAKTAMLHFRDYPDSLLTEACRRGEVTARQIAEAARAGDIFAKKLMEDCGTMFGRAMSLVIDLLNPERIVAGGVFMRAHDLILPTAWGVIERETLPQNRESCQILPSELGEQIGDYGAIAAFTMS